MTHRNSRLSWGRFTLQGRQTAGYRKNTSPVRNAAYDEHVTHASMEPRERGPETGGGVEVSRAAPKRR